MTRKAGRPPMTPEQRAQREQEQDMHVLLPLSLVKKLDDARGDITRKAYLVEIIRQHLEQAQGE